MLLTQDEAEFVWCPMARVVATDPQGSSNTFNRVVIPLQGMSIPNSANCVGQFCAWWRWTDQFVNDDKENVNGRLAYCGAAGGSVNAPLVYIPRIIPKKQEETVQ